MKKIKLTNAASMLLFSSLDTPGWANSVEEIVAASTLMGETFGKLKPKFNGELLEPVWAASEHEYRITTDQYAVCRKVILELVKAKRFPTGRPALFLLRAFDLGGKK